MCGFAGFLRFSGPQVDEDARRAILVAMGRALERRGPDDAQYFDDGVLSLVFRRLSIVDVDGGQQPFFNHERHRVLVANGEIYNHGELRVELSVNHAFASRSDCEPLLHGFDEWDLGVLQRARGMFALAHWDANERVLTLARDRLGIKPLYVCELPGGLLFGSELKALLMHPDCPRSLAWPSVDRQPIAQPHATTYVRGVDMLPGGHYLRVDARGGREQRAYWRLEDHFGAAPFGERSAAYVEAYANVLEQATLQHLQRDVPAALHLSGGVDSSLLAAIVAKREPSLSCFTVVERISYNEGDVAAARHLTERFGLPWFPVRFDYRTLVEDAKFDLQRIEEAVWMMDSPRLELDWLFKEELHRAARAHLPGVKVVLLGQGADEFAGGYSRRVDALRRDWDDYLDGEVASNLVFGASLGGDFSADLWHLGRDRADGAQASRYHRFMSLMTQQLQHHNLWHEDRTSSWQSLEARVPFLDHRVVELLASVPHTLHAELFWDKKIVRAALERHFPDHAIRQPKLGFLDGRDTGSLDVIQHRILAKVAPEFREKYLADDEGPFDPAKLSALIDSALGRGPMRASLVRDAFRCIAITIFERQLRVPLSSAQVPSRRVLGLMSEHDWQTWSTDMRRPPVCGRTWHPDDRIVLAHDLHVEASVKEPSRLRFYRGGVFGGELGLPATSAWVASLLRNLGTEAAADFRLQDWLDEFDLDLSHALPFLDILLHQGAIAVAAGSAATAAPGHPAAAPADVGAVAAARPPQASGVPTSLRVST